MKYLYRFFFIVVGFFFFFHVVSYCENNNGFSGLEKSTDYYYYYEYVFNNDCEMYCMERYQDISGCSLHNHLINNRISDFRRFMNLVVFFLTIGWIFCGCVGFIWILWALNRMHTGGADNHD